MRFFIMVAALAVGCQADAYDSIPASRFEGFAASLQGVHDRMHARFAAARRMEASIARSDLDQARVEAHALDQLDEPDIVPAWRPYLEDIRFSARRVELATNPMAAAEAAANVGASCARCHVAIGARVVFRDEPRPGRDPHLAVQMADHQWGAVQMWEGLIGPSDARWLAGAQALTTVPINIVAMSVTPTSDLDVDDVSRIRNHARHALQAVRPEDRARVFGELLATCAHCHAILRDR
jgi:cytochrome c553